MIAAITGLAAGLAHVLTGPDHLAAIAPLAAHRPKRAWIPGVRWGIGHSTGVAMVGLLFLWLHDLISVDLISSWSERLVGVMLCGIGLWAWRQTIKNSIHAHEHEHDGDRHVHIHIHSQRKEHNAIGAHRHTHAAFGIGALHGLAGSSHFLGVLPILALPSRMEAFAYLFSFCIGTVAAMAGFSWGVGRVAASCSIRGARAYRGLASLCALAAMGIGGFWLIDSFR